jgi:DNA-binding NtrC family response regulator
LRRASDAERVRRRGGPYWLWGRGTRSRSTGFVHLWGYAAAVKAFPSIQGGQSVVGTGGDECALEGAQDRTRTIRRSAQPPLGVLVRVLETTAEPKEFRLQAGVCRLGSGRDADVLVDDETVSRMHAELRLAPEGVLLTDLGSRNGTYYLGQRVQQMALALGSRFRIGNTELSLECDRQTLDQLQPAEITSYGAALGLSSQMRRLFAVLLRLENSLTNVLLQGETGTGKDLLARAIHDHSQVSSGPFVAINCGMLDRGLARSELFGHKKGAFTGAIENRIGAFEAAAGGTLFLDEVGELPLDVQPALLRALESGAIVRVGDTLERSVNVRVVAATNTELGAAVEQKAFRADLYYRLAVITLRIPPLRERSEDLDSLARHFAEQLGLREIPAELMVELRRRPWPGNVRELRNVLQAYHAVGRFETAVAGEPSELEGALRRWLNPTADYAAQKQALLDAFQRVYLAALLRHTQGNQSEAARISGLQRSYLGQLLAKANGSTLEEKADSTSQG